MKVLALALSLTAAMPALAQGAAPPTVLAVADATASPLAAELAVKLFPNGTYRQMLGPAMTRMMSGVGDGVGVMPLGALLRSAGLPEEQAAKLDKGTIGEIMAITDPYYKERLRRGMDAMFAVMIPMFEELEPDLRAGLAVSLDHRFTPSQLRDLRAFFATPTGNSYASQQKLLFMDPAVMGKMQTAMPRIMQRMPALLGAMTKATADLPKPKTLKDLTSAERTTLAKLLDVDPLSLNK